MTLNLDRRNMKDMKGKIDRINGIEIYGESPPGVWRLPSVLATGRFAVAFWA
jgi:hypothetical protein